MPDKKIHQRISKERTKEDFEELHSWMDEAQEFIKWNHRIERHIFNTDYKRYIKEKWGDKAVAEWLLHIALDNLQTARVFAFKDNDSKDFDEVNIKFKGKRLKSCEFK